MQQASVAFKTLNDCLYGCGFSFSDYFYGDGYTIQLKVYFSVPHVLYGYCHRKVLFHVMEVSHNLICDGPLADTIHTVNIYLILIYRLFLSKENNSVKLIIGYIFKMYIYLLIKSIIIIIIITIYKVG